MSVGNLRLILVAAVKYWSKQGGISSRIKTFLFIFTLPKIYFSKFDTKNSPMCWLSKQLVVFTVKEK